MTFITRRKKKSILLTMTYKAAQYDLVPASHFSLICALVTGLLAISVTCQVCSSL